MKTVLRAGIVAVAGLTCAPLVGCVVVGVDSQGQIVRDEKRFPVDGVPDLRLSTFDGAIEVRATEGSQVLVEIEKRGPTREAVDELRVEATQNGSRIDVEVKRPSREGIIAFGLHVSTSAKLTVSVPRRTRLVARTGDGAIRVDGVEGRLELRTGDGAIHASDVKGELVLNTGDGSITVDHAEGRLSLETGDGGVNVEGKLTAVRMHTGDGSIVYRADEATQMDDDWEIPRATARCRSTCTPGSTPISMLIPAMAASATTSTSSRIATLIETRMMSVSAVPCAAGSVRAGSACASRPATVRLR